MQSRRQQVPSQVAQPQWHICPGLSLAGTVRLSVLVAIYSSFRPSDRSSYGFFRSRFGPVPISIFGQIFVIDPGPIFVSVFWPILVIIAGPVFVLVVVALINDPKPTLEGAARHAIASGKERTRKIAVHGIIVTIKDVVPLDRDVHEVVYNPLASTIAARVYVIRINRENPEAVILQRRWLLA